MPEGREPWHVSVYDAVVRFVASAVEAPLDDLESFLSRVEIHRNACWAVLQTSGIIDSVPLPPPIHGIFELAEIEFDEPAERMMTDALRMLEIAESDLQQQKFVLNALVVSSDMVDERGDDSTANERADEGSDERDDSHSD